MKNNSWAFTITVKLGITKTQKNDKQQCQQSVLETHEEMFLLAIVFSLCFWYYRCHLNALHWFSLYKSFRDAYNGGCYFVTICMTIRARLLFFTSFSSSHLKIPTSQIVVLHLSSTSLPVSQKRTITRASYYRKKVFMPILYFRIYFSLKK